jgi:hypothetical protein
MQRAIRGQAGVQRFFNDQGRAFCLYVVIGSFAHRQSLVTRVNQVLATLTIDPSDATSSTTTTTSPPTTEAPSSTDAPSTTEVPTTDEPSVTTTTAAGGPTP